MIANGGQGIVTPDGKLHTDDPKVREAAIKSVEVMTGLYKDGVVPPEALSWNDADDNNAFHEKLILMDFDGTLSTELAMIDIKEDYHNAVTMGLPLGNDGKPMVAQVNAGGGYIPKGAPNVAVAKDLMKVLDAATGDQRQHEGGARPLGASQCPGGEDRPLLAAKHGPARDPLCQGDHGTDHPVL